VIQSDDRRRGGAHQFLVKCNNLFPIRFIRGPGFSVQRCDGALNLIVAGAAHCERCFNQPHALIDLFAIPKRTILFFESDEFAPVVDARGASRILQEHQRQ
jgi:hypothetical protein